MRIVLSILGQCAAHMVALVYSVATVWRRGREEGGGGEGERDFGGEGEKGC